MVERRGRGPERGVEEEFLDEDDVFFFSSLTRMSTLVLLSARGSISRSLGRNDDDGLLPLWSSGSLMLSRLLDRLSDVGRSEDAKLPSPCFDDDGRCLLRRFSFACLSSSSTSADREVLLVTSLSRRLRDVVEREISTLPF